MLESFTHGGEKANLVIDDRRDRGDISNGGAQQSVHPPVAAGKCVEGPLTALGTKRRADSGNQGTWRRLDHVV